MLTFWPALCWLGFFCGAFALAGLLYARRGSSTLEDYIVARNSQGVTATVLTLMASSLGAWILFAPAQAATWGGVGALIGYAFGAMAPRLAMIPLGQRMRRLIPEGHTLTEFVITRYGRGMYGLTLAIMLFYLLITLTAELTAMARLMTLLAPVPLWVTASLVLGATLVYTAWGGLAATIFTDKLQMLIIAPLLLMLVALGWRAVGGAAPVVQALQHKAPQLLQPWHPDAVKSGLGFFVAVLLTGLFHQGYWQRIYAARSTRAMRAGFLLASLLVAPVIFIMGLFGLAYMAGDASGDSAIALFTIILPGLPLWLTIALIPLGLALIMSSADTAISALASIIAVDAQRLRPAANAATLMRLARALVFLLCIPVLITAAQGYSVLYLFLLADLLCAAAAFPVFFGLYNRRCSGGMAMTATLLGLAAGIILFPAPGAPPTQLLESFLLAACVPALVIAIRLCLGRCGPEYDFAQLRDKVRRLPA